jgi:hypothetical protein
LEKLNYLCSSISISDASLIWLALNQPVPPSFGSFLKAGHFANATQSGNIISPSGTSINSPKGPGNPTLEQIFQKAITLRATNNKTKGIIKNKTISGAIAEWFIVEMTSR